MTTPPPPAGNDKTTLFGVLGIILALCCWPVGVIFAVLSLNESKKHGTSPALAYVGFAVAAVNLIVGAILTLTGGLLGG